MTEASSKLDFLSTLTGGKPYVFVVMKYAKKKWLFKTIKKIVEGKLLNMVCLRGDMAGKAGQDLLSKIHCMIENADIVIADISTKSENVFYESGYSVGINKPPILIKSRSDKTRTPVDLQGSEIIYYSDDKNSTTTFEKDLLRHVNSRLDHNLTQLRDMLESNDKYPNYIMALPKSPGINSPFNAKIFRNKTDGDYLGIIRLTSAFGSLWGFNTEIELVSPQHCDPKISNIPGNLYLIGSSKINPITDFFLGIIGDQHGVRWTFEAQDESEDPDMVLVKRMDSVLTSYPVINETISQGETQRNIAKEDYGLIVRYPRNDCNKNYLVVILAGAHSLGTGAASVAATDPRYINMIRDQLSSKTGRDILPGKENGFWVLVRGRSNPTDKNLDKANIEIIDCGNLTK